MCEFKSLPKEKHLILFTIILIMNMQNGSDLNERGDHYTIDNGDHIQVSILKTNL